MEQIAVESLWYLLCFLDVEEIPALTSKGRIIASYVEK